MLSRSGSNELKYFLNDLLIPYVFDHAKQDVLFAQLSTHTLTGSPKVPYCAAKPSYTIGRPPPPPKISTTLTFPSPQPATHHLEQTQFFLPRNSPSSNNGQRKGVERAQEEREEGKEAQRGKRRNQAVQGGE